MSDRELISIMAAILYKRWNNTATDANTAVMRAEAILKNVNGKYKRVVYLG